MQSPVEPRPEAQTLPEHLKRIFQAIIRHPFRKLSALLLAIAFWAIVIASDPNLMIEKTITGAVVAIQGQESLRNRGFIVMDDLTSEAISVKMRVSVKHSDFDRATAENFSPRLDLGQQIVGAGENQRVVISAPQTSLGTVLSFDPAYIEIDVEPYAFYRVPVVVERTGEASEPLWIQSAVPDIASVTVSGPKSLVERIRHAVATLPLESLSAARTFDSVSALLELRDDHNAVVSSPLLAIASDSVNVDAVRIEATVYPLREFSVDTDSAVIGLPEHGYALKETRVTPATVSIAASAEVLDAIESLHVQNPLNISGAEEDEVSASPLREMSGVLFSSVTEIAIEADIAPATHTHTFVGVPVTVMGLAPNLSARLSKEEMTLTLRGDYISLDTLTADKIHLTADVTNLSEGAHTVWVECLVDGVDTFSFTPEMPRLTVTLSALPPE